jgi:hypothetical protein
MIRLCKTEPQAQFDLPGTSAYNLWHYEEVHGPPYYCYQLSGARLGRL